MHYATRRKISKRSIGILSLVVLLSLVAAISVSPMIMPAQASPGYPHLSPLQAMNATASVSMSASASVSMPSITTQATSMMSSSANSTISSPAPSTTSTEVMTATQTQTVFWPYAPFFWYPGYAIVVGAPVYSNVIALAGPPAVQISSVAVAPATPATIAHIYYNGSVIQISFSGAAPVQLTLTSSIQPTVIYADKTQLVQVASVTGLTPTSNSWVYTGQTLTIFADPSALTIMYNSAPSQAPSQITTAISSAANSTTPVAMNQTMTNSTAMPAGQSAPSSGLSTAALAAIGIIIIIVIAAGAILFSRQGKKPSV